MTSLGVDRGGQWWSESVLRGWGMVRVGRILSEKDQGLSMKVGFGRARVGDDYAGLIPSRKG